MRMRKCLAVTISLILLPLPALAAKVIVLDGDTIIVDGEHVRIANIDTPEIGHARCDDELRRGLLAKERLKIIIQAGDLTIVRGDNGRLKDKYKRSLGRVVVNGRDAGEILISEGLARRWDGRRHPWCE
jgi:endonuclease YncB( thermonuclease family)